MHGIPKIPKSKIDALSSLKAFGGTAVGSATEKQLGLESRERDLSQLITYIRRKSTKGTC